MKKVLTKIKSSTKKAVNQFNEHPIYYSLDIAAFGIGIAWGLWAKDKTTEEKVKSIIGSYLIGSLLGFIGFLFDTKLNKERKAE